MNCLRTRVPASLLFLIAGLASSSAFAARKHGFTRLSSSEVMLKQITGPSTGLFYGLKWSREGARCRATQGNPEQPQEWVPIPSRACKSVRDYIIVHRVKLRYSRLSKSYVYTGVKPGRAFLEFSGNRFLVSLLTAPVCDAEGEHCKKPKLSEASKLALEMRHAITRELGKLPEWVKPPGTETLGDP